MSGGDGLGNVNENTLPSCQISQIRSIVEGIYDKITNSSNAVLEDMAEKCQDNISSIDDLIFEMKRDIKPLIDRAFSAPQNTGVLD